MSTVFKKIVNDGCMIIDWEHYHKVYLERERRGIKSSWDFSGPGSETRTYDKIPKHKLFDFLRKAFENCPWTKIKKFKLKNNGKEYHVDCVYWDYELCGYVLNILYHNHYDEKNPNKESHGITHVMDINCIEPIDCKCILSLSDVIVIE